MSKPRKRKTNKSGKCSIAIFYELHDYAISGRSLTSLVKPLKGLGYKRFAFEADGALVRDLADSLEISKAAPKEWKMLFDIYNSTKGAPTFTADDVRSIKDPNDPLLEAVYDFVAGHPSVAIEFPHENGDKEQVAIRLENLYQGSEDDRAIALEMLETIKTIALKRLADGKPHPRSPFGLKYWTVIDNELQLYGMEKGACDEWELISDCRDKYMHTRLNLMCAQFGDGIVAFFSLSRLVMGKWLSDGGHSVNQFYIVDYPVDPRDKDVRSHSVPHNITIIDVHSNPSLNYTQAVIEHLCLGLDNPEEFPGVCGGIARPADGSDEL